MPTQEAKGPRDTIRHFLDDWPHVPRYLQQSLDHKLIALHGEAILRRSLNTGRMICFVGSGVSMSYGRLGWGEMVRRLLDLDQYPLNEVTGNAPLIKRLKDTLQQIDLDKVLPVRYPAIFQLGEELAQADSKDGDENTFRKRARQYLFDDLGHAHVLYEGLAQDLRKIRLDGRPEASVPDELPLPFELADCSELTRSSVLGAESAHKSASPPTWHTFFMISNEDLEHWEGRVDQRHPSGFPRSKAGKLMEIVRECHLAGKSKPSEPTHLRPLHRFVLPALLRLVIDEGDLKVRGKVAAAPSERPKRPRPARCDAFAHPLEVWPPAVRSQILPKELDPLMLLADGLSISRFITTNYDLDLERMMRDRGFAVDPRHPDDSPEGDAQPEPKDALGAGARDAVFQADRALELVDFAVRNPDHAMSVMHLHGRATQGDDMIVTERDYLERYLGRGDAADLVNTSISLAFGANPLLFVGSGMSEDDILRPLRQFLAERKSRVDRQAVVLLPADASRGRRIEETIAHYNRYGVFTMHFGLATLAQDRSGRRASTPPPDAPDREPGHEPESELQWLALARQMCSDLKLCVSALIGYLDCELQAKAKAKAKAKANAEALANERGSTATPQSAKTPGNDEAWRALADATRTLAALRTGTAADAQPDSVQWPSLLDIEHDAVKLKPLERLDGVPLEHAAALRPTLESRLLAWAADVVIAAVAHFLSLDLRETWELRDWPEHKLAWQPEEGTDLMSWRRLLTCTKALLDGIPSALAGLCLSAKLTQIRNGWLEWKVDSEELPKPRPNGGPRWLLPQGTSRGTAGTAHLARQMPILMRHGIALKSHRDDEATLPFGAEVPETDRFLDNSPSHTFRVFCRALQAERKRSESSLGTPAQEAGRRVFVLHAARGVGKGHFFECLSRGNRLNEFARASWPEKKAARYCAQASFNLSFCHEVASVFDRLANLLVERAHVVFAPGRGAPGPGPAEWIYNANLQLGNSRVGRLKRILELYAEHHEAAKGRRIFIAINGFNFLFDERGYPKNAQLHRVVMAILGKESAWAPVDFVLVCTESGFPRLFRSKAEPQPELKSGFRDEWARLPPLKLQHLPAHAESEKQHNQVQAVLRRLRVSLTSSAADDSSGDQPQQAAESGDRADQIFFHVLQGALASTTVIKYFPEVALAIAARAGVIRAKGNEFCVGKGDLPLVVGMEQLRRAIFEQTMRNDQVADRAIRELPRLIRWLAVVAARDVKPADPAPDPAGFFPKDGETEKSRERLGIESVPPAATEAVDQDFAFLFKELGSNRFLLTIFCAAASEAATAHDSRTPGIAVDAVMAWIQTALTRRLSDTPSQREDAIIATVLSAYRERHERQAPLPQRQVIEEWLRKSRRRLKLELPKDFRGRVEQIPVAFCDVMAGPLGWALQQEVLWHLAVVGHPVEADVLAEAPKIQAAAMRIVRLVGGIIKKAQYQPAKEDRQLYRRPLTLRVVQIALDMLAHRCLVFRLHPVSLEVPEALVADGRPFDVDDQEQLQAHRDSRAESDRLERARATKARRHVASGARASPNWRFSLHRFVQRAIFRRLHSPFVEYPQVDQFSLSMWATQPDDLPRPNAAAARDISELMADWTGYPRSVRRVDRQSAYHSALHAAFDAPPPPDDKDRERIASLPARMLRAAFGVARSVFSVGVVSRYHESQTDGLSAPEEGYFEQHRLQIRWLLRNAVELMRKGRNKDIAGTADAPFFAEEIVWLYNECGLLCLVEGRLEAAAGLFRRAWRAAQRLEPNKEHGALWCRIHLNLAIVEVERGQIRAARHNLEAIRAMPDENPILRLLAHGLFGMTEQLMGDLSGAEAIYLNVIADLQAYGQSRAVAIFARQLGELYRRQGTASSFDKAEDAIERAIERAHQGGHEDIRQLAKLSRARLRIDRFNENQVVGRVQEELDAVERYGYSMGMPRIVAEVAYAR